jgi:hypothetical protein
MFTRLDFIIKSWITRKLLSFSQSGRLESPKSRLLIFKWQDRLTNKSFLNLSYSMLFTAISTVVSCLIVTDFVCLLTYEFCLSLWTIARCSVILLLPLFKSDNIKYAKLYLYYTSFFKQIFFFAHESIFLKVPVVTITAFLQMVLLPLLCKRTFYCSPIFCDLLYYVNNFLQTFVDLLLYGPILSPNVSFVIL